MHGPHLLPLGFDLSVTVTVTVTVIVIVTIKSAGRIS